MGEISFRFLENGGPSGAVQNIATALGEGEAEPEEVCMYACVLLWWGGGGSGGSGAVVVVVSAH